MTKNCNKFICDSDRIIKNTRLTMSVGIGHSEGVK